MPDIEKLTREAKTVTLPLDQWMDVVRRLQQYETPVKDETASTAGDPEVIARALHWEGPAERVRVIAQALRDYARYEVMNERSRCLRIANRTTLRSEIVALIRTGESI